MRRRISRAALIRACVPSHPLSACFPARGLDLFAPFLFSFFFAEDFSTCAASGSALVASGLWPNASQVRFLLVGSPVAAVRFRLTSMPFHPVVIFTCRVGSISRSCTAIIVFCRRLRRIPFNIQHFRGPCPMPRLFSSPFQSG